MKQHGTKAFSFQPPCTPLLEELPLRLPSPGPSHPAAPRLRLLPDKAGFRPVRAVGGVRGFCHGDEL